MQEVLFWINFVIGAALTAAIYGVGPMLFVMCRKKQPTVRALRIFCAAYTLAVWVIVQLVSYDGGQIRTSPAILWSYIFYRIARSVSAKKSLSFSQVEKKEPNVFPQPEGEMCETPFAQVGETSPVVESVQSSKLEQPALAGQASKKELIAVVVLAAICCVLFGAAGLYFGYGSGLSDGNTIYEKGWNDGRNDGFDAGKNEKQDQYEQTIASMEKELSDAKDSLKKVKDSLKVANEQNAFYREFLDDSVFLQVRIGFIVEDGTRKYHSYGSACIENYDTFWAHNVEYCEYLGYEACKTCF